MNRINPNFVTALRAIFFAPLVCVLLVNGYYTLAIVAMAFGELTDFFDGFVARRTNQISDVGKLFDPLCDSIFHMTIWMTFLSISWVPLYAVVLFFVRDSVVSTIRSCLAKNGIALAARWSGKVKAGSQAVAQFVVVASHIFLSGDLSSGLQVAVVSMAAIITLWSLVDYSWCFYGFVKSKKVVLARTVTV